MNRKGIVISLIILMVLSLCGCAKENAVNENIKKNNPNTVENVIDSQVKKEDGVEETKPAEGETVQKQEPAVQSVYSKSDIDLDLTALSANMTYAQVSNMMGNPDDYADKVVRFDGYFSSFQDASSDKIFNCCIIPDAQACCAEGLEFVLLDGYSYPQQGQDIMVTGIFKVYYEETFSYCVVENAEIVYI